MKLWFVSPQRMGLGMGSFLMAVFRMFGSRSLMCLPVFFTVAITYSFLPIVWVVSFSSEMLHDLAKPLRAGVGLPLSS